MRDLGAVATVKCRTHPTWSDEVLRPTGGLGADTASDVGGPATLNQTLRFVRHGGRISAMGGLTGFDGHIRPCSSRSHQKGELSACGWRWRSSLLMWTVCAGAFVAQLLAQRGEVLHTVVLGLILAAAAWRFRPQLSMVR